MSNHIRVHYHMWHDAGCCGGEKREFRVTRPEAYNENTPGHTDITARQGYYVNACCATNAALTARISYKDTISAHEPLDVQTKW